MYLGPELGMNITPLSSDTLGKQFALGWYGGGNFEYRFTDWFSLRTGIYYSQNQKTYESFDTSEFEFFGFNIDSLFGDFVDLNTYTQVRGRITQHYFQIPLLASFNYEKVGVFAGPYAGLNFAGLKKELTESQSPWVDLIDISSFDSTGFLSFLIPPSSTSDLKTTTGRSGMAKFDFGFKFGLRYQEERFGINAAYTLGLLDYRSSPTGRKETHQYFQLSMNYLFGLSFKKGSARARD